jgi:quercetin 2,3-dioxygenase
MYRAIERVLSPPDPGWVGNGFRTHNFFPSGYRIHRMMSPFYLLDYNAKINFTPSESPRGVDVHPHKGFETVTIAYQGKIAHKDSAGNSGVIGKGGVQWMTAGAGILHKEFHEESFQRSGGPFQMVQLWVNLPAKYKSEPPGYQDIDHESKGVVEIPDKGGKCFLIAGELNGVKGPARTFTTIEMYDIRLAAGGKFEVPVKSGFNTGLLVIEGNLKVNEEKVAPLDHFVLFKSGDEGDRILLESEEGATVLFLSGEPIDEPIAQYGPFLMNTHEELQEALREFQTGKYGTLE